MTGSSARHGERQEAAFARRLQRLFDEIRPRGRPYRQAEVVKAVNAAAGERLLSPQYLSELLRGDKDEPSLRIANALATFFGVRTDYFFTDDASAQDEAEAEEVRQNAQAWYIARRANRMSDASLASLQTIVDQICRLEGIDLEADDPADSPQE